MIAGCLRCSRAGNAGRGLCSKHYKEAKARYAKDPSEEQRDIADGRILPPRGGWRTLYRGRVAT